MPNEGRTKTRDTPSPPPSPSPIPRTPSPPPSPSPIPRTPSPPPSPSPIPRTPSPHPFLAHLLLSPPLHQLLLPHHFAQHLCRLHPFLIPLLVLIPWQGIPLPLIPFSLPSNINILPCSSPSLLLPFPSCRFFICSSKRRMSLYTQWRNPPSLLPHLWLLVSTIIQYRKTGGLCKRWRQLFFPLPLQRNVWHRRLPSLVQSVCDLTDKKPWCFCSVYWPCRHKNARGKNEKARQVGYCMWDLS